jgi:hypothetical protein
MYSVSAFFCLKKRIIIKQIKFEFVQNDCLKKEHSGDIKWGENYSQTRVPDDEYEYDNESLKIRGIIKIIKKNISIYFEVDLVLFVKELKLYMELSL